MRILCVCDEGNNRSVHIAHVLRYRGHDTLSVGVRTASPETLRMLLDWAELVILTDSAQALHIREHENTLLWPIPDTFRRPFHPRQHGIVKAHIERSDL